MIEVTKFLIGWVIVVGSLSISIEPAANVLAAEKVAETTQAPAQIPPVTLSKAHEALCKVKVGDVMPAFMLPQLSGGAPAKLSWPFGKSATVVVFWKGDRRMAREQLADMKPDVIEPFGKAGVAVVGIAVGQSGGDAQAAVNAAKANFPNFLDADGKAFAQVGSEKLPRTYLLDPQGKILWFDIEYSHGTRRELNQALQAVVGKNEL